MHGSGDIGLVCRFIHVFVHLRRIACGHLEEPRLSLRVVIDGTRIISERRLSDRVVTLEDLGKEFGITKERTRQLEVRAMARLREALTTKTQRPSDLLLES